MKMKPCLRCTLRAMTLGQTEIIPAGAFTENAIRNSASLLGSSGMKFRVHRDKTTGEFHITKLLAAR